MQDDFKEGASAAWYSHIVGSALQIMAPSTSAAPGEVQAAEAAPPEGTGGKPWWVHSAQHSYLYLIPKDGLSQGLWCATQT